MSIFNSYLKEGPGIEKDAPKKQGLGLFCDIFMREAWGLIELNLIFALFCIPVITIGPALGAMTTVTMKMVRDQNCYIWRDFWTAFRENFKRFFLAGLVGLLLAVLIGMTMLLYLPLMSEGPMYVVLFAASLLLCFLGGLMWIYFYPMATVTDLPLRVVLKNSMLLGVACLKHSVPALLVCLTLVGPVVLFFPQSIPVGVLISISLANLVSSFAAWAGIRTYVAQPKEEKSAQ